MSADTVVRVYPHVAVYFTDYELDGLDRYANLRELHHPVRHDGLTSAAEKLLEAVRMAYEARERARQETLLREGTT